MADLINENLIAFDLEAENRDDAISKLVDVIDAEGRISNKDQFVADILKRESTCTTAIGFGIATPHAKSSGVKEPALAFAKLAHPIKWDDESEEINTMFMIGVEESGADQHLEILASIFRQLVHKKFRDQLAEATSKEDIVKLISSL